MERFGFSEKQAQAIVDMRLGRLTGLEREKLVQEYEELLEKIAYYKDVLSKPELVHKIICEELLEIKSKYGMEEEPRLQLMRLK